MTQTATAPRIRPETAYRREFFDIVMASGPGTVLDVGCGDGTFLRAANGRGVRGAGLEVEAARVAALTEAGLDVRAGRAEALPFADGSFDSVVLGYVSHHFESLARALAEAARVAAGSVFILDVWYDTALPSQRVAEDYDLWSKAIDRRTGMVHNPLPCARALIEPLAAAGCGHGIDYRQRLVLTPWPIDEVTAAAERQLARIGPDAGLSDRLARILDDARLHGISDDGAIMLAAHKG